MALGICIEAPLLFFLMLHLLQKKHHQKAEIQSFQGEGLWMVRPRRPKQADFSCHWIILYVRAKLSSNFHSNGGVLSFLNTEENPKTHKFCYIASELIR